MSTTTAIPNRPAPPVPNRWRRPSTWPPIVRTIGKIILWVAIVILLLGLGLYLWSKDWSSVSSDPAKQPASSQDIRDMISAFNSNHKASMEAEKAEHDNLGAKIDGSESRILAEIAKIKAEATASVTVPKRRPFSEILAEHRARRPAGTAPRALR